MMRYLQDADRIYTNHPANVAGLLSRDILNRHREALMGNGKEKAGKLT